MTNALPVTRATVVTLPSQTDTERMWKAAQMASRTDMVPKDMKGNPATIMATALAGRELGLGFFESLRSFYSVNGRPTESAELMMTLALRAGHDVRVLETNKEQAVVGIRRSNWPETDPMALTTFDMDDARQAGLDTKTGPWKDYTRAMLRSRAVSEAVRTHCPEVLVGATYTPEELGAEVFVTDEVVTPVDRDPGDFNAPMDDGSDDAVLDGIVEDAEAVEAVEEVLDAVEVIAEEAEEIMPVWDRRRQRASNAIDRIARLDEGRAAAAEAWIEEVVGPFLDEKAWKAKPVTPIEQAVVKLEETATTMSQEKQAAAPVDLLAEDETASV